MRRAVAITIGAGMIAAGTALGACGAAEPGEAADDSLPSVTSAAPADLSDGLITCAMPDFDGKTGLTVTERFILIDGQPKRYSDFNNQAFDLCQAGQDNCALKIENGVIRMDWTSANGTRSRYDVDLGTLDIAAYTAKTGEAERPVAFQEGAKCVREPLPEGLQVM
ncbi:hypothetical protein AAG593_10315 [Citromicrobium bathyomarinum]